MRLRKLALRNFRAFSNAELPAIDLDHSVVLFSGKNGAGKTSLFEAFELFLAGSIERVGGIEAVGKVLVNVREPDTPARLALDWTHNGVEGSTPVEINKSQSNLRTKPLLDDDQVNSFRSTTYLPQATMRRVISAGPLKLGEIIKILAVSERSELLLEGISQANISRRDEAFQYLNNGYQRQVKILGDAEVEVKALREALASAEKATIPLDSWSHQILDISNQLEVPLTPISLPSAGMLNERLATVERVLQSRLTDAIQIKSQGERAKLKWQRLMNQQRTLTNLARMSEEQESNYVKYESEVKELDQELKAAREDLTTLETEANSGRGIPGSLKLLVDAKELIALQGPERLNVCPICDQTLKDLAGHIDHKLQALTAAQSEQESRLSLARAKIKRIEDSRREKIKKLTDIKNEIRDRQEEGKRLSLEIEAYLSDYWSSIGVDCTFEEIHEYEETRIDKSEVTINKLTELANRISSLRSQMSAASTRSARLTAEITALEQQQARLTTSLADAKAAIDRVDEWIDTIQWVRNVFSNQLQESLDAYANQYVSRQFAELFERICGHPYWGVKIPEVRVRYHKVEAAWNAQYGDQIYPGEAVLSQGELNACALAMFLALATAQTAHPGLLLLDDPIQSMDEIRIEDFALLLKSLKDDLNWQLVIAVHEESVFDYLKRQLYPSSQGQSLVSYKLVPGEGGAIVSDKEELTFHAEDFLAVTSRDGQ